MSLLIILFRGHFTVSYLAMKMAITATRSCFFRDKKRFVPETCLLLEEGNENNWGMRAKHAIWELLSSGLGPQTGSVGSLAGRCLNLNVSISSTGNTCSPHILFYVTCFSLLCGFFRVGCELYIDFGGGRGYQSFLCSVCLDVRIKEVGENLLQNQTRMHRTPSC